jgi:hypothetical protein
VGEIYLDSEKKIHFIGFSEIFFAAITAAVFTVGRCVYSLHSIFVLPEVLKEYALLFVVMFIPALFIFAFAGKGVRASSKEGVVYSEKMMWMLPVVSALLIMTVCFFFVSFLRPDSVPAGQSYLWSQAGLVRDRYPVIHTLLRQPFIHLDQSGTSKSGTIIFLVLNVIIQSAVCGYVVRREMAEGFRPVPLALSILFLALVSAIYALIGMNSEEMHFFCETLFFCVVMMLLLCLSRTDSGEKNGVFFFVLLFAMACLLRYNFIPAAVILCFSLLFKVKKTGIKKFIIASFTTITIVIAIILVVYPHFGITGIREKDMMGVPVNQVATVYANHEPDLTVAEKFIINNYMSMYNFNSLNARWGLNAFDEGLYLSDRSAFWDLYMHLFNKYPYDFVDSFLKQNVEIWQPGEFGIPLFMILLGIYIAIKSKRPGYSAGITAVFILWMTYLFGVGTNMYHMYPFSILIPVVLLPVFSRKTAAEEIQEDADDGILDDDELTKEIEKLEIEEKKSGAVKPDSKKEQDKKEQNGKDTNNKKDTEKKVSDKKKESEQKSEEKKKPDEKKTADNKETVKKETEPKESEKKEEDKKKEPENKDADKKKEADQKGTDREDTDKKKSEDKESLEKKESEEKDPEKKSEKIDEAKKEAESKESEKKEADREKEPEQKASEEKIADNKRESEEESVSATDNDSIGENSPADSEDSEGKKGEKGE